MEEFEKNNIYYEEHKFDLTNEELGVIFEGMDKDDYTNIGWTRYIDFDKLKRMVIFAKRDNGGKRLKKVILIKRVESFPPRNTYELIFE